MGTLTPFIGWSIKYTYLNNIVIILWKLTANNEYGDWFETIV